MSQKSISSAFNGCASLTNASFPSTLERLAGKLFMNQALLVLISLAPVSQKLVLKLLKSALVSEAFFCQS